MKKPTPEQVRAYFAGVMPEHEREEFELRAGSDAQFARHALLCRIEDELEQEFAALQASARRPVGLDSVLAREKAQFWKERIAAAFRNAGDEISGALEVTIDAARQLASLTDETVKALLEPGSQRFAELAPGVLRTRGSFARARDAHAGAALLQMPGLADANIKVDARKPEVLISFLEGVPPAAWLVPDDPRSEAIAGKVEQKGERTSIKFENLSGGAYVLVFQRPPAPARPGGRGA